MQLKILTYNIFQLPYLIKTNKNDYKQQRLDGIIKIISEFDIICIQESFDVFSHRQFELISKAKEAGFLYFARSDSPNFFDPQLFDGGEVILSKYPIVESRFFKFGKMGYADGIATKGVLYCNIEVPGVKTELGTSGDNSIVHLFTTHNQANYEGYGAEQTRGFFFNQFDQILFLRETIQTVYYESNTIIIQITQV